MQELKSIVRGLRTQPSRVTGQSPFYLVYGSEAVLPANLLWRAPRLEHYSEEEVEKNRAIDVDSAEETRMAALIQSARYLQNLRKYHDRNIQERSFNIGDLVLRRTQNASRRHKLMSPWEGPFVVKEVTRPGSFCLAYEDRTEALPV